MITHDPNNENCPDNDLEASRYGLSCTCVPRLMTRREFDKAIARIIDHAGEQMAIAWFDEIVRQHKERR